MWRAAKSAARCGWRSVAGVLMGPRWGRHGGPTRARSALERGRNAGVGCHGETSGSGKQQRRVAAPSGKADAKSRNPHLYLCLRALSRRRTPNPPVARCASLSRCLTPGSLWTRIRHRVASVRVRDTADAAGRGGSTAKASNAGAHRSNPSGRGLCSHPTALRVLPVEPPRPATRALLAGRTIPGAEANPCPEAPYAAVLLPESFRGGCSFGAGAWPVSPAAPEKASTGRGARRVGAGPSRAAGRPVSPPRGRGRAAARARGAAPGPGPCPGSPPAV